VKKTSRVRAIQHRAVLALIVGLWTVASSALAGSCTVSSSGLAFGTYQPLTFAGKLTSADKTSTATVSIMCTGIVTGGSYSISLGAGTYGSGNRISTRYLNNTTHGGDYMAYNLFTEASFTTVWGDGSTGSLLNGSIAAGSSTPSHTVYGKIPAGQNTLKAGSFSDSLTMTLTYNP
jgi:spore coat protein U-like protein